MSILKLDAHSIDLGKMGGWVWLLDARPFDLEARETIRMVAGVPPVLSIVLLALAALGYFEYPLE